MRHISDNYYLHGLNLLPQFGPKRLAELHQYFGSFRAAFQARAAELKNAGIGSAIIKDWLKLRPSINVRREKDKLSGQDIKLLSYMDPSYPRLLKAISRPPVILYYKGLMRGIDEVCVAVVGTRKITGYGRTIMPLLIEPLVHNKMTIVSGLAYGVDALAHQLALDNSARTIAVLGCGLDEQTLYPPEHSYMAQQIIKSGGAILSEYVPGTPALKQNFVSRNRIISGLSLATIVVECDSKSGALITAQHAFKQNRPVYAVPGPIYSTQSRGPNNLLKAGARCATSAADIFDELKIKHSVKQLSKELIPLTAEEEALLSHMDSEPITLNDIIKISGLDAGSVVATLTFLEMKGRIKHLGSAQYNRI